MTEISVSSTYIGKYIDKTKNPIEEIANLLQSLVQSNTDWESNVCSRKAFQKEWKHLIRSKCRSIAYKTGLFCNNLNKKILFDYFEEKRYWLD